MVAEAESRRAVRESLPEIESIGDAGLRAAVVEIWAMAWQSSEWQELSDCPKATELPVARSLVTHSRVVAQMSAAMCDVLARENDLAISRDEVITIALLHDVSKLYEFTKTPGGSEKSEIGRKYQHGFLAALWMHEAGLSTNLVHAVISHTPLSGVIPQTQEALIVHYADFADTDALLLDAGLPLFCKRK
jgi:putative nucleotidyltransferase with HDIG domain